MIVAPSILSIDFTKFTQQLEAVNQSKATWIHFDVMDGHFVPNLTFGPDILKAVKQVSPLFCDVHLMVKQPLRFVDMFIKAQADQLTFHLEAMDNEQDIQALIDLIKSHQCKVGISIKPNTDVAVLKPWVKQVDLILIMSVEPGFGGQSFIDTTIDRIKAVKAMIIQANSNAYIQVDGGINEKTGKACLDAGCDVLVAGSYIFKHDIQTQVQSLWQES